MPGRLVAQVVASIAALLIPLAYASPPDPTWITGVYDNADYDDVVLTVMSASGVLRAADLHSFVAPQPAGRVSTAPETAPATSRPCLKADRAPPLS